MKMRIDQAEKEITSIVRELDTVAGMLIIPAMAKVAGVKEAMEKVSAASVRLGEFGEQLGHQGD